MEDKTLAMELLTDLKATNKRQFIVIITILVLWFSTVCLFVWYINQFDYYTEKTTLGGNGINNYIGKDGDINNGDKSSENSQDTLQEKQEENQKSSQKKEKIMCKFDFTRQEAETIKSKLYLTEDEEKVFEMKLLNYSITKIALELNVSERTASRIIKRLKNKIMKVLQWQKCGKNQTISSSFFMG